LYQDIIDRTYEFISERIEEDEKKQLLVEQLNNYVGSAVQKILDDEKDFYDAEPKDRLKVPPYNMIKRIPRDYTAEVEMARRMEKDE